jgi:hypothetical protein
MDKSNRFVYYLFSFLLIIYFNHFKMNKVFLSSFLIGLCMSCVTPINNFEQISSTKFLTIDATITDQPNISKLNIYKSSDDITNSVFKPISQAKIYYLDEKGLIETLTESSVLGTYLPSKNFKGKVGSTYTLFIETSDGSKYQSSPETMKASPEIDKIFTNYELRDNFSKGDARRGGFNVYVDFQDSPTIGDNYQWVWTHYERANTCSNCFFGTYNFRLNTCVINVPPTNLTLNYRCNTDCWNISYSSELNVLSDSYLNGKRITGKQVARVPFDSTSNYYLQLEQRVITRNAFNYYQDLKIQTQNNGTLFDIPAETQFSFNIKSVTNPDEKILGIFDVYSVKKKIIYIDRISGVPTNESPVFVNVVEGKIVECTPLEASLGCMDKTPCVEGRFRTKMKPEGWKD